MTLPSPKLKETRNNGKLILSDTNMLDSSSAVKKTHSERGVSILENQNRGYDRINDSALVITQSPAYNYDSMIIDTLKHAPSRY